MAWISLLIAGLFEMIGVLTINKFHKDRTWISFLFLAFAFGTSFLLLAHAMKTIPMGIAYAIWTGIGTAGGALLGMIFYHEPKDWKRISFIGIIIGSVIGLKLIS